MRIKNNMIATMYYLCNRQGMGIPIIIYDWMVWKYVR